MMPVVMKIWRQHELWDGTYVIDDLLDLLEALEASSGKYT